MTETTPEAAAAIGEAKRLREAIERIPAETRSDRESVYYASAYVGVAVRYLLGIGADDDADRLDVERPATAQAVPTEDVPRRLPKTHDRRPK